MNYWLLTSEFPPFHGGGISTYSGETVAMLSSIYNVTVFVPDKNVTGTAELADTNIRIIRFNPFEFPEKQYLGYETLCSFTMAKILERYLTTEGSPEWIETQEYNGLGYFTLLSKKTLHPLFKNLKIAVTIHAPSFICLKQNHSASYRGSFPWIGYMEKFSLLSADILFAPSEYILHHINQQFNISKTVHHLLRNPFSFGKSKEDILQTDPDHFVFYGKAAPIKGILTLLKTFEILWNTMPSLKLELIGGLDFFYHAENQLMGDLIRIKYRHRLQSKQLLLTGKICQGKLPTYLKSARAVIIPSTLDNLPYAMIECMAEGKIVIASKTGGQSEVIQTGINGFLFNADEGDALEKAIVNVRSLSAFEMNQIGRNAISTTREMFSPEKILPEKLSVLNKFRKSHNSHLFPFVNHNSVTEKKAVNSESVSENCSLPPLTVIVPFYNMGPYLDECILSIKQSEYSDISIVIINDGSNEAHSLVMLNNYRNQDSISVIDQKNSGLSSARNKGAKIATTDLIAFLDPDDKVEPTYYKKAAKVLQFYQNVHFVGAWVQYFGESNSSWPCFTPEPPFILYHNTINASSLVFRRESFLLSGGNDSAFHFGMEDYDTILSHISRGLMGVALPEKLFNYRVRKGSMMRQFTRGKELFLYQLLTEKHSKLYQAYGPELSLLLNCNGPGYKTDNFTIDTEDYENKYISMIKKITVFRKILETPAIRKILIRLYTQINKN